MEYEFQNEIDGLKSRETPAAPGEITVCPQEG
jgi:hypothetical protein